jgi:hypothetical protein
VGYLTDRDGPTRQHVLIRWWSNSASLANGGPLGGVITTIGRWWRGHQADEGTYAAVYAPTVKGPAQPVIVFPVANDAFEEPAGNSEAVVVGEVGLNGVCCLELPDGSTIWPTHNPVVPTSRLTVPSH